MQVREKTADTGEVDICQFGLERSAYLTRSFLVTPDSRDRPPDERGVLKVWRPGLHRRPSGCCARHGCAWCPSRADGHASLGRAFSAPSGYDHREDMQYTRARPCRDKRRRRLCWTRSGMEHENETSHQPCDRTDRDWRDARRPR